MSRGVVGVPKSGKVRHVDMTSDLLTTLQGVFEERFGGVVDLDADAQAMRQGESLDALFFPDASGGIMDDSNVRRRIWKPLLAAAELPHRRIHDLRHSYASLLLQDGAELLYVSQQLGHHSAAFTLQRYGHLMRRDRRHVVDRLEKLAPIGTLSAPGDFAGDKKEGAGNEKPPDKSGGSSSAPCVIRTHDLLIRSQMLYPAELRAHSGVSPGGYHAGGAPARRPEGGGPRRLLSAVSYQRSAFSFSQSAARTLESPSSLPSPSREKGCQVVG